jgi:hypothetical protein
MPLCDVIIHSVIKTQKYFGRATPSLAFGAPVRGSSEEIQMGSAGIKLKWDVELGVEMREIPVTPLPPRIFKLSRPDFLQPGSYSVFIYKAHEYNANSLKFPN